uniref:Uncharacterized protein n=1 Tax=Romanomermis culicivorax TaxID=13658 RepID=A0A915KK97_ROMCU
MATTIISFVTVALLFCGICYTNSAFVIPYLVWQAVETIFLAVIFIYVIVVAIFIGHTMVELHHHEALFDGRITPDQQAAAGVVGVYVVLIGLLFGVHVWWFCLVRRLYEYLRIKRARMFSGQGIESSRPSTSATA